MKPSYLVWPITAVGLPRCLAVNASKETKWKPGPQLIDALGWTESSWLCSELTLSTGLVVQLCNGRALLLLKL